VHVAAGAVDAEAVGAHRVQVGAAREEHDVGAGFGEAAAEVAADSAGPDHGDTHGRHCIARL